MIVVDETQAAENTSGGTSVSVTVSAVADGKSIIVFGVPGNNSSQVLSVTDNGGNTYDFIGQGSSNGNGGFWWCPSATNTPTVITFHLSISDWPSILVWIAHSDSTFGIDNGGNAFFSSGTQPVTTPSATTSVASELLLSGMSSPANGTFTVDSPWTRDQMLNDNAGWPIAGAHQIVTSTGTFSATWSSASTDQINAGILTLSEGGGGGGSDLSGQGELSVSSPTAITVHLTTVPDYLGTGKGNPIRFFEVGNVAFGKDGFFSRNFYLEHEFERIEAPFSGADTVKYSFGPLITAVIGEIA